MGLYLWLILFALFISFISIVLFNYVGSDLKTIRYIYKDSRLYDDIKSMLLAVAELYRQDGSKQGQWDYFNGVNNYQLFYNIHPINDEILLIELSDKKEGNRLLAKGIVQWRESIGEGIFLN